jgi:hypothetical protein
VIVAVECHRACSQDDVVWLEPLQLLALTGLGGNAGMQRKPGHLAHRVIERLLSGRRVGKVNTLRIACGQTAMR